MTTSVVIKVNGAYTATVVQRTDGGSDQTHSIKGGEEKHFLAEHGKKVSFEISETDDAQKSDASANHNDPATSQKHAPQAGS